MARVTLILAAIALPLVAAALPVARSAPSILTVDPPAAPAVDDRPVSVFAELDGTWKGIFVGYDEAGRELYRIRVQQTYETIDATTQTVTVRDEMADGTVITGRGRNVARRGRDGAIELQCVVEKSNGDRVSHAGRVVKGPDGDEQLMWYTKTAERVETFRESVRHVGAETVYEINGMGRYGNTLILMHGRYRKQ